MTPTPVEFTKPELALATGATIRQLQTWTEAAMLHPEVRSPAGGTKGGRAYIYSSVDAALVRFIMRLRQIGVPFEKIEPIMRAGRARLIAAIHAGAIAAYVDRSYDPTGPRLRIFKYPAHMVEFGQDFPGTFAVINLWLLGVRAPITETDLASDPAFRDEPFSGIVCLNVREPASRQSAPVGPIASERDWTEDAFHENGKYACMCVRCGQRFIGHKRRVVCLVCFTAGQDRPIPEGADIEEVRRNDGTVIPQCLVCKIHVGGQHRPSCYRQGIVTRRESGLYQQTPPSGKSAAANDDSHRPDGSQS